MSGTSGARTLTCPICGCKYRRTNWMIRTGQNLQRTQEGKILFDTHQISCYNKRKNQTTENQNEQV